jgi:hypothetical protein
MLAVTGATGKLGQLVVAALLQQLPPGKIAALVRAPAMASDLAAKGVIVREADYDRPETLGPALAGVDKLLLISGSEIGRRVPQHKAVIDAAKAAGVKLIAYTSLLHADTSSLGLADEHRQTEVLLKESGVPYVLLRNGWYTENYTASIPAALQHGALLGSAGEGRIAWRPAPIMPQPPLPYSPPRRIRAGASTSWPAMRLIRSPSSPQSCHAIPAGTSSIVTCLRPITGPHWWAPASRARSPRCSPNRTPLRVEARCSTTVTSSRSSSAAQLPNYVTC